ncbi:MAG: ribonuclease HII [Patescibacteria group bacterium]
MLLSRKNSPNFFFEKRLWKKGLSIIAGVDEVGRGCFAGPIVAGCAIFSKSTIIPENIAIDDSKKLSPRQRERGSTWVKENALTWGIGEVQTSTINRLGMAKATKMAFRKAVSDARKRLGKSIDYLLIDAFFIPYIRQLPIRRKKDGKGRYLKNPKGRQRAIINGDEKSLSIAAASIIAKVYRDKLMLKLSKKVKFKKYGWGRNKGYGTKEHQLAIKAYGITRYHRKVFVKNFLPKADFA